jgi:2-oxoisovalerate dehydrogenase E1 component
MVVRIAGFAYQKGFGGHFHNDNSIGALRDIPGLLLAAPSRGDDAARMLRGCVATAKTHGRVVAFLEPIALYHQRDLLEDGDLCWLTDYPMPGNALVPGQTGVYRAGRRLQPGIAPDVVDDAAADLGDRPDVLVVTYANGVHMSLRAAAEHADLGNRVRVMDVRWLNPLPMAAIRRHAAHVGRVLVVDEARATGGGIGDAVVSGLVEHGYRGRVATVRSADSYVPLGPAADHVLLGVPEIVEAVGRLVKG